MRVLRFFFMFFTNWAVGFLAILPFYVFSKDIVIFGSLFWLLIGWWPSWIIAIRRFRNADARALKQAFISAGFSLLDNLPELCGMRLDIPNKKIALLAGHEKGKYIIKTFDFSQIVQWKFEKEGNIAFEIDSLEHPILRAVFPYVNQAEDWSLRLKTIMGRANEPAQA